MQAFRQWSEGLRQSQASDRIIKKISGDPGALLVSDRDYISARIWRISRYAKDKTSAPRAFIRSRLSVLDALGGEAVFERLTLVEDPSEIGPGDHRHVPVSDPWIMRGVPYRGRLYLEIGIFALQSKADDTYLRLLQNLSESAWTGVQPARRVAGQIEMGLDLLLAANPAIELVLGLAAEFDAPGSWIVMRAPASVAEGLQLTANLTAIDATGAAITDYPYFVFSIEATENPPNYFELPDIDCAHEELMDLLKEGELTEAEQTAFPYFRRICLNSPDLQQRHAVELVQRQEQQMRRALQPRAVSTEEATPTWTLEALNLSETGTSRETPPARDQAEYLVWYGTNRRPVDPSDHGKGYSATREEPGVVHYGSCQVFVPRSHKIGSIGKPWWQQLFKMEDDRLTLIATNQRDPDPYWSAISAQLSATQLADRDAVIFVHGYNVSFEQAALRAAQIGFDLSVRGAMAFFSWPSRGRSRFYTADEATIEASEGAITDFIKDFAQRSGADRVHIIAHSMGNRGVLRAVNRIGAAAQRRTGKPFDQMLLAAADVDAGTFRQLASAYPAVAKRTTLYVSKHDRAVGASHWLHDFPRVGLMPPTVVLPNIDTVNVTDVDLTWLGHGYVADARPVLADMHALIKGNAPPEQRIGLRSTRNERGELYWLIGA